MARHLISRRAFIAWASAAIAAPAFASDKVAPGRIETLSGVGAGNSSEPRIRIWLPPGYNTSKRSYRTLYMLDGQFVFEGDSNGENFATDRRIARLGAAGKIQPSLIVAIDNLGGDRFLQFMPQAIYDRAEGSLRAAIDREIDRTGGRPSRPNSSNFSICG